MSKCDKDKIACAKKTSIGGQALMEGVMMRGPKLTAMAVRNTKGEVVVEKFPTQSTTKAKFFKLPIIRGVFNYIDSMVFGTKCLLRSAELSGLAELEEELEKEKAAKKAAKKAKKKGITEETAETENAEEQVTLSDIEETAEEKAEEKVDGVTEDASAENTEIPTEESAEYTSSESVENVTEEKPQEKTEDKKESSALITGIMILGTVLGFVLAIGLFLFVPTFIYDMVCLIPAVGKFLRPENEGVQSLIQSVFEGILKLIILIGYMWAISFMKDIRRTFMYHGAEHKTIFCYEAGLELTVENVRIQKKHHPRCGTSFLIIMVILSIIISFFINPLIDLITGGIDGILFSLLRVVIKFLLLPLIVGIGYELIKIAGRHDNLFTKIISAPGVWLQHLTVFEPDDDMIECAIASMKEVIPDDESDKW